MMQEYVIQMQLENDGYVTGNIPIPIEYSYLWQFQEFWFGNMLPEMNDPLTAYVIND